MPYPFPRAGLFFQDGTGIVAALYRPAYDVISDFAAQGIGLDDTAAFQAAINLSSSTGIPVYVPPVNARGQRAVYGISQPLLIPAGVRLLGDAMSAFQGPTIKALAAMSSILQVACIGQNATLTPTPAGVERIALDGNQLALYGIERLGDWLSLYDWPIVSNCLLDGIRGATHAVGLTFGTVAASVPGGSPSGVTFGQYDRGYSAQIAIAPSTTTIVVKATSSSAFVTSFDGGVTFATAAQTLTPGTTSRICYTQGAQYLYETGATVSFPSGTYHAGDTWTVAAQQPQETGGNQYLIEAQTKFQHPFIRNCGAIYASSPTLVGQLSGICPVGPFLLSGTVTTDPATRRILGSGTNFLTGPASTSRFPRMGDFVWLQGASPPQAGLFPIAAVLDDGTIVVPSGWSLPSLSGVNYLLFLGSGWRVEDNGDDSNTVMSGGQFDNVPTAIRSCGDGAGSLTIRDTIVEANYGCCGVSMGGIVTPTQVQSLYSPEVKGSGVANTVGCSIQYICGARSVASLYSPRRSAPSVQEFGGPGFIDVALSPSANQVFTGTSPYTMALTDRLIELMSSAIQLQVLLYPSPFVGMMITVVWLANGVAQPPPFIFSQGTQGIEDPNSPQTIRNAATGVSLRTPGQRATWLFDGTNWILGPGS